MLKKEFPIVYIDKHVLKQTLCVVSKIYTNEISTYLPGRFQMIVLKVLFY